MATEAYEIWQNQVGVKSSWLVDAGVMTAANLKQMQNRGDVRVLRRGCRNTPALVAYNTIPARFRREVLSKGGNPYVIVSQNMIEKSIEHDEEAAAYFDSYRLADGRILPAEKRREYSANAIVLKALDKVYGLQSGRAGATGVKVSQVWENCCRMVEDVDRSQYPINLPSNARKLKAKLQEFKAGGFETLIHKSYIDGNTNAAKIKSEEQQGLLVTLLSDPRNLDSQQVCDLYNYTAEKLGWPVITRGAVENWKTKKQDIIYARRHGENAHSNEKTMLVRRAAPKAAMAMWVLDGWDAELFYKNDKGYYNRLCVEMVIDPSEKYIVGYAIADTESAGLIKAALRSAVLHTKEIFGDMYKPAQIQSDHYAQAAMTPIYGELARYVTPAKVGNAKAKVIEPFFRYFNKTYCQMCANWSGFGVTASKSSQPNIRLLATKKSEWPDREECIAQIERFIEIDRQRKIESFRQAWGRTESSNRVALTPERYLEIFGEERGQRVLMQSGGFRLQIDGMRHEYDCFDPTFRKHAEVQWRVKYDPDDLSRVLVMNERGDLRYVMEEKHVQPMALIERQEGDYQALERVREFNAERDEQIREELGSHIESAAALIAENRRSLGDLQKFLITDGRGQHKDRKGAARLAAASGSIEVEEVLNEEDIFDNY